MEMPDDPALFNREEGADMHLTDIVWWAYTAYVVVLALFMLFFAYAVREREE